MALNRTLAFVLLIASLPIGAPSAAQPAAGDVVIKVLSNRADLISGGDAYIEVVVPDGGDAAGVRVDVDGRDVSDRVRPRDGGRVLGVVTGLTLGDNIVTATLPDGRGARIVVRNHGIGGPVFSGPQVEPWLCETEAAGLGPAVDEDCNAPTKVEWFYKSTNPSRGGLQAYDPESPPTDVAMTTTDEGNEVPFVVRRETGTLNRGIYRTAVLHDPTLPLEPWGTNAGWNNKLYYKYEGGAAPQHRQGTNPSEVLVENALARGFAVATATLNRHEQNTNSVVSAETTLMVTERLLEQFGELRYTMSTGCSGGSIQQHLIANAYPGLLDGLHVQCSYMDIYTTATEIGDCSLLDRYYNETSPQLWAVERQRAAVNGHVDVGPCQAWDTVFNLDQAAFDPRVGCLSGTVNPAPSTPEADYVYDPEANPAGVRCTYHDYQVALFGQRPPEAWTDIERTRGNGFGNRPYDNVGVQYGLAALEAGEILPEQFVDLNEKVGGFDIDRNWIDERVAADPFALEAVHRTGQMNDAVHLDNVPIVDNRGSSNHEIHTDFRSWAMRERLIKANGDADNQIIWTSPEALVANPTAIAEAFDLLDAWLTAIEADASDAPVADKVAAHRPDDAVDACWIGGQKVTDREQCSAAFPYYADPRIASGAPFTDDVLKCQLEPLDRADYGVEFSDALWSRMEAAFRDGVCDYEQPGVGAQPTVPWLTFLADDGTAIPGGRPLGAAPVSVPFAAGERLDPVVTRISGAERVATAIAINGRVRPTAETVVLARSDAFPDALAGGPLAVAEEAALLLTPPDALAPAVRAEIRRLGAGTAILLGGEAALAPGVASELEEMGLTLERIAGPTRYATAAAIAARMGNTSEAFVASGEVFPDALSAAALAGAVGAPVLLTENDRLPEESLAAVPAGSSVIVVGGGAAVGESVVAALEGRAAAVRRVSGSDRYATSTAMAREALDRGVTPTATWVATGRDFPDALAAGAAAGAGRSLLVLIDGTDLDASPSARDLLRSLASRITEIRVAGGAAALSESTMERLAVL